MKEPFGMAFLYVLKYVAAIAKLHPSLKFLLCYVQSSIQFSTKLPPKSGNFLSSKTACVTIMLNESLDISPSLTQGMNLAKIQKVFQRRLKSNMLKLRGHFLNDFPGEA